MTINKISISDTNTNYSVKQVEIHTKKSPNICVNVTADKKKFNKKNEENEKQTNHKNTTETPIDYYNYILRVNTEFSDFFTSLLFISVCVS